MNQVGQISKGFGHHGPLQADAIARLQRQGGSASCHNEGFAAPQANAAAELGMAKSARHCLALHQHRLFSSRNRLVAGPPKTVVLGHSLFDPAAIDGVELNALTRIAHQGFVEPNPAELGQFLWSPRHGAAIEDRAREPVAVIAQAAQGQGLNPVEKSAVDGRYGALGAGEPEQ